MLLEAEHMLKKYSPVWIKAHKVPRQYIWLSEDKSCDVCVVGGGVTGALCALRLAQAGAKVVLITANQIGFGATASTMPCAEYDSGTTLINLSRRLGQDTALTMLELGVQAVSGLEQLAFELGEECSFSRRDCLLFTDDDSELEQLNKEYLQRRKAGFDCSYVSRGAARDVFPFDVSGGIISKGLAAEVDPYILTHLCVKKAVSLGAEVYENTRAERLESVDGGVEITTSAYRTIKAKQVVVAAGSACADIIGGLIFPRTYFMGISRPMTQFSGWPGRCVIRSWSAPRVTYAASPDGRICACGLDTAVVDEESRLGGVIHIPSLHEKRFEELSAGAKYLLPQMYFSGFEAVSAFRGCRTADEMPIVGRAESQPNCVFAVCCGAGGLLMSEVASQIVTDICCGDENELAEIFSPERRALQR